MRRRFASRSVLAPLAGLVVLSLAACAGASGPPTDGPPSPTATSDPGSAAGSAGESAPIPVWLPEWAAGQAPAEVANRVPLPFCGVEQAPGPQPGIFVDRAVRLCFWNAHQAGAPAEFVSIQTTIEGAPIATVYRLPGNGTVELFTDMTQDPFGPGAWLHSTCATVVEAEGDELLGVDGCDEGRELR